MRKVPFSQEKLVDLPDEFHRIISFSPSVTEILYEFGMEESIVGVSAFCARPEKVREKRRVGSYGFARQEVLKEMDPDIIMMISGYQNDFFEKISREFPAYMFELPLTMLDVLNLIKKVGIVTNRYEKANELVSELMEKMPPARKGKRLSAYLEIDLGGPVSFGAYSYITDALRFYGFDSIFSRMEREWITPDLSDVKRADPDVIIYEPKMYSKFDRSMISDIMNERGWSSLKAVKNGHVFVTPGKLDFFAHHGPSFIREVLPWLDGIYSEIIS
ncbi:MAG: ABC transporter substrate-binding protein [Thermoplasmata archaeon]